ncbi:transposase family protein [Thiolapillus sp.]|uniref:transposase family protein n=1 Tax=Thiolapillus sp. TaxID=2017437 RepID=UPI003AF5CC87
MGATMELEEHYSQLLGIDSPWEIYDVELKVEASRLDIWIEYMEDKGACPECGATCPRYDTRKERTWRHLDTMQFSTHLHRSLST